MAERTKCNTCGAVITGTWWECKEVGEEPRDDLLARMIDHLGREHPKVAAAVQAQRGANLNDLFTDLEAET